MTDLALLNSGKVGIRVDAGNGVNHEVYVDNVKLTEYDADGNPTVVMEDGFDGGAAHYFELTGKNATYAQVVDLGGDYALYINCDGTTDKSAKVRLIQTDSFVCTHNFVNGICSICDEFQEPGYDIDLSAYTIGNLGQLIRFAQIVNGGGNWQRPFMGKFYGNNHVISNLYVKTDCEGGLFSRLRGGYIENLGLVNGHIESTANLRCGVMAGEHHDNAEMVNCYARGNFEFVTSHAQKNAMAGETAGGHFINCYTTLPQLSCSYPMGGDTTNSYEGVNASDASTTGGELCYLLNGSSCYDATWRQNIGTDTYPELDPTHGIVNKISSAGYTTQYIPSTDVTIPTGVKAYAGETSGTKLSLKELTGAISKDDAVILQGSEGFYSFVPTTGASKYTDNALQGSNGTVQGSGNGIYALSVMNEKVGFYPVGTSESPVTIPAGKAYLVDTGGSVKGFTFVFDEDATGISLMEDVRSQMEDGAIYNLAGQRLNKAQKGINIIGGKKMVIGK